MMRMFKENYEDALQRKSRERLRGSSLTEKDMRFFEAEAKIVVCETGISMYEFRQRFDNRYETAIGNDSLHEAIDQGIRQDWFQLGKPKNYVREGSPDRNIVLTQKGFERIFEKGFEEFMAMTHSLCVAEAIGGMR
jgi:hypothetical protein